MYSNFAQVSKLASNRPSGTTAAALMEVLNFPIEVTAIAVTNVTGSAADFSLFHTESGSPVYDETSALYFQKEVAANDTLWIRAESVGAGIGLRKDQILGFQAHTGNALNVTVYGVAASIANPALTKGVS